ncbi:alpha-galactosidase [Granulicella mallensis]|uniref:Glycoside hydrolase clan GH-D n=1 Tax=Granulicella mallensis (strain ATCC BAA-1857 / DSM 23137 / MP5ACTX8) TaxID=682795 RepID=G8NUE6_GRAMM|nr:alpha-galactosidase [Granulicella mallensis]AEU35302.1 glycoside hydrolase clan GH-D [Granulicella mallensis MP5ACTX8]
MKQPILYRILGLTLAIPFAFTASAQQQDAPLQLKTDATDGSYSISAPGISMPILRATAAAKVNGKWLHAADYPKHLVSTKIANGELGTSKLITIQYTGRADAPDLLLSLRTYDASPFGDMQLTAHNTTSHAIEVQELRVLESEKGKGDSGKDDLINLGGPASADRVLNDSFSEDRPAMQLHDLSDAKTNVHRAVGVQLLYNQQSKQSWFIGALTSNKFLSVLRLHMAPAGVMNAYEVDSTGTTELLIENSLHRSSEKDRVELSLSVPPGGELSSERMLFGVGTDYHGQLETYAHLIRDIHHALVTAPTPIGWWSWTAYYFGLDQGTALTNAQWLSQHLKPLGYDFFHIDEGYQFARGEYATPDASLFPEGMGSLEHKVINEGLTPGIWTAPFEVSERSWVYTHHPEWLVHNAQGEPIHIGFVTNNLDHLYALDTTHPGAQAYLHSTYSKLTREWGLRYIKLDFMEDSAIEGFYHVPQTTALEAQRIGIQTIRDAVGPNVLLDKDGCELLNPVGLVDTGRISQDTGHTFSSSKDAATGIAARYYMNRNYFLADPDAFSVSTQTVDDQHWHGGTKQLTLDEAKISIVLSAVSGGLYEIGDDLPTLGEAPDRLALVENRDLLDMARLGRASVPLDLMTYDPLDLQPSIFELQQTRHQSIVTVFNWSEISRAHSLTRAALGLDPKANYTVSEVLTTPSDSTSLSASLDVKQPAHSVRVFKIINTDIPAEAPMVNATVALSGKTAEPMSFSAVAKDAGNPILNCTWDFGDGITVAGVKTTHSYTHAGSYTVGLRCSGFAPQPAVQTFAVKTTGSVATKFVPTRQRRFEEEGEPKQ